MGPTASGKTAVAAHLAYLIGGDVVSGDSRQTYRGMDIGTGKDLSEYVVNGKAIPYHLIDICEPGERYNIYRFKHDFYQVLDQQPPDRPLVFCGGSGLYMEAVLAGYHLPDVPEDSALRHSLAHETLATLTEKLRSYGPLHNTTDITSKQRVIRAIEIAQYRQEHPIVSDEEHRPSLSTPIFVLDVDRETRRHRISTRLVNRIEHGLVEEVEQLLQKGVSPDVLIYYGLEYKYVTEYILGLYTLNEMTQRLEIAIHQFAKRQMTWLRGMERRGFTLTYITPDEHPALTAASIAAHLPHPLPLHYT